MSQLKRLNWRLTFVLDIILIAFAVITDLVTGKTGGTIAFHIVIVELIMWLFRLVWISPALLRFILRRLLHMIPIVLTVLGLGFVLIWMAPGDALTQMEINPSMRPQDIENFRVQFGLDKGPVEQFFLYVFNAVQGNFGFSIHYKVQVFSLVQMRASNTLVLSLAALVFSWSLSIPMGIAAATKQYKWQDQVISVLAFVGLAIPNFFLAFLLQFLITKTGMSSIIPLSGMTSINHETMHFFQKAGDVLRHMILPVFVLGTSEMATLTRIMRANMLDVLNQQYIVTARAKGQKERVVVYKHALRNAINPMITILGFQIASVMSGAALTEIVLSWPGLGSLILQAILSQDLYLVIGSLLYSSILLVIGNLIADILLATVDPRVRVS